MQAVRVLRPQSLTSSASLRSAPSPASGKAVPHGKLIRLNYVLCCAHDFRYGKASPMPEIPPLGEMSRSDKRGAVSARRKLSRSGATRLKRLEVVLRTKPDEAEGDKKPACAPTPVLWRGARFLVPFFRAEKRNCPPHRRKVIVRRSFGASTERLRFSLCRL